MCESCKVPKLLSFIQASWRVGLHECRIRKWAKEGKIAVVPLQGQTFVVVESLEAYIAGLIEAAKAKVAQDGH